MADLSPTAANVHIYEGARLTSNVVFGATMTAGQSVVYSSATWVLLDANTSYASGTRMGVVIVGAASGNYGVVCEEGPIDVGASLTLGNPIIASTTAGGLAPSSDWSGYSAAWQYHIGYPQNSSTLYVRPYVTGASVA